jgi:mevalonate kinase
MMAYNKIIVSAPASIMLLGEHAVLEGGHALAMAINQRIALSLTPRKDSLICIHSELFGSYETSLETLIIEKPFDFMLESIRHHYLSEPWDQQPVKGFNIEMISEISTQKGFGTSAAITVAMITALDFFKKNTVDKAAIFLKSREVIQSVQGRGSGTDVLASTMGHIVRYRMAPLAYDFTSKLLPLTLIYAGYKTPTKDVIAKVQAYRQADPQKIEDIFAQIDTITQKAITALETDDIELFGHLMSKHHDCQKALGVSDETLEKMLAICRAYPILGAKISGSGLGDCLVVLGDLPLDVFPNSQLPQTDQILISMDTDGVKIDEAV